MLANQTGSRAQGPFDRNDPVATNQGRVPVVSDGGQIICDSWAIAEYLEDTYPDRPTLFRGEGGRAHARFVNEWAETVLLPNA